MRALAVLILGICAALGSALHSTAAAQASYLSTDYAPKLAGVWQGTFRCGPADWQMDLALSPVSPTRLIGTLSFAAKGSDQGAYLGSYGVEASVNGSYVHVLPTTWLQQAPAFSMLALTGSHRGESLSGDVDNKDCGKYSVTRVRGSESQAFDIAQTLTPAARIPIEPLGEWEVYGTCYGIGVKGRVSISESYSGDIGGMLFVQKWDGDRASGRLINYRVASPRTGGSTITFLPTDKIAPGNNEFPVDFTKTEAGWVGRSRDPGCTADTLYRHPRPDKLVGSTGEALAWEAWLGKSPFQTFAGGNIFDFLGLPQDAVLKPSESPGKMQWSAVSEHRKTLGFYACPEGDCVRHPQRKAFFAWPRLYAAASNISFISAIGPEKTQVCRFQSPNHRWQCVHVPAAFPAWFSNDELYVWGEGAFQKMERAWKDANPDFGGDCGRVARPHRDDEDPTVFQCSPVIAGPAMPTLDRQ